MPHTEAKEITTFCLITIGLGWIFSIPLWLSGLGLKTPNAAIYMIAFMWSPALTGLLFYFWSRRKTTVFFKSYFNLGLGKKWFPHWLLHIFIWPLFAIAAPFVAHFFGVFELDLSFAGFEALVMQQVQALGDSVNPFEHISVQVLVAIQLASSFSGAFVNLPVVIGEELGWRGFLLPRLKPLGFWKANVIVCLVWSIWHTPLLLLGHNYPTAPFQGLLFMCGFCLIIGTLINWSCWRTESAWPGVFAHGAINGSAAAIVLFQAEGHNFDSRWAGMTGITGWLLPIILIGVLLISKRFKEQS